MAMDSGLAEHATVIDAAPQLVGGSSFLEVDSPAALGGVCVATTPVSSMNWSRQLHRGDSEDAVALSATRAFLDECEVDSEEEGYQVRGYCWSSSPDTVASARSGADGGRSSSTCRLYAFQVTTPLCSQCCSMTSNRCTQVWKRSTCRRRAVTTYRATHTLKMSRERCSTSHALS